MTTTRALDADAERALPAPPLREQPRLLRRLFADPTPVLDELDDRYGPTFSVGRGPARMAFVGDPIAIGELFTMPNDTFRWNHRFNVLGFIVGKGSMIVSDGDDHRRRRSAVQHGFSRRRLNRWVPMMVDRCDAAIDTLLSTSPDGVPVDLYPVARRLVLDIVVRTLFGDRLAGRVDEIGDLFVRPQAYLESSAIRQLPHPFPFTARARVRADRRTFDDLVDAELAQRRRDDVDDPDDLLAVLAANDELSDAEIRDQVGTLIGAGYHTTAASLSWMLWCAVLEPGLWSNLGSEADAAFADRPIDHQVLTRLGLADRVMRETLRLHPAGVVSLREARRDVELGGYRIPAGTIILWSPYLAGRDPQVWADPLRFDPDRFYDPTEEQRMLARTGWVPFGGGGRNCIGFALAQMELTVLLARLAQRLDLTAATTTMPQPVGMVVNRPAGGVTMRVHERR